MCLPAAADPLRVATWGADLSRRGPGLLLAEITKGESAELAAVIAVIRALDADLLLLTDMDFDTQLVALAALQTRLAAEGLAYPHGFALRPNAGVQSGFDLDGNGRQAEPRDAWGYGEFAGQGGMALLSRLPLAVDQAQDYTGFRWADLPGALLPADLTPPDLTPEMQAGQPLSSVNHWQVAVELPGGGQLALLGWKATPPVFDGPEDRNGRRNHDEAAFWLQLLAGALPYPPPAVPFVLLGDANLDAESGDGRRQAIRALLDHPQLQDPVGQTATADFAQPPGPLRVDYLLPSTGITVRDAGVLRPESVPDLAPDLAANLRAAGRHFPVWADLDLR